MQTKSEDKEDIIKGLQSYICTMCFKKNPSLIAFDPSNFRKSISEPPKEDCTLAIPISSKEIMSTSKAPDTLVKCEICSYFTNDEAELAKHKAENHEATNQRNSNEVQADVIEKDTSQDVVIDLVRNEDNQVIELEEACEEGIFFKCTICNSDFEDRVLLENHIDDNHKVDCPLC